MEIIKTQTYRHTYLIGLFCGIFLSGAAQNSLTGLINTMSGEAIPYANALILNLEDSSLIKGSISEIDGSFELKDLSKGTFLLHISMLGYSSHYQQVLIGTSDVRLDPILLSTNATQLEEVMVTARKPLYLKEADRLIVNVQSSINSAGKTALQILQKSPGVSMNQQNGSISLKGKTGVQVMINGKISPLPPDAVVQMLDGLSAANIDKIEFISTPASKYDAAGNAGIINIIMTTNLQKGTKGNFGITAGHNGREKLGANINLNHRSSQLHTFIDYSIRSDRNQEIWIEDRTLNHTSFNRSVNSTSHRDIRLTVQNLRAGLEYNLTPNLDIRTLLTVYRRDWETDALTKVTNRASRNSTVLTTMDILEDNIWQSISSAIGLVHRIGTRKHLSLDFDFLAYINENPSYYTNTTTQQELDQSNTSLIDVSKETPIQFKVIKLDYANQLSNLFSFDLGIKATLSKFDNSVLVRSFIKEAWKNNAEFSNTAHLDEKIWAGYLSWSLVPTKTMTFKGGLRYEFTASHIHSATEKNLLDREFGTFFPTLAVSFQLGEDRQLNLAYTRRINRPTFNDMAPFVFFTGPNSIYAGNPALLPAITGGIDFSYQLKRCWFSVGYSSTKNSIGWLQPELDPLTNVLVFRSHNLAYLNVLSLSSSIPISLTSWWEIQNSATISHQVFRTQHYKDNFEKSAYTADLNSTWTFSLPKNYVIELSGTYQNNILYGIWKNRPMGQMDFGIRKKLNARRANLTLTFSDIFHTNIWAWDTHLPGVNAFLGGLYDQNLRAVQLTFSKNFGKGKLQSMNIESGSEEERKRVN